MNIFFTRVSEAELAGSGESTTSWILLAPRRTGTGAITSTHIPATDRIGKHQDVVVARLEALASTNLQPGMRNLPAPSGGHPLAPIIEQNARLLESLKIRRPTLGNR